MIITTGEPAGIGMDVVIDVLCDAQFCDVPLVILADAQAFAARAKALLARGAIDHLPSYAVVDLMAALAGERESSADLQTDWSDFNKLSSADAQNLLAKWADVVDLSAWFAGGTQAIVLHIQAVQKVVAGELDAANAPMVALQLTVAHLLAAANKAAAIITAPLQKSVMIQAGIRLDNGEMFSGHTEFFMAKSGCEKVVMMLANQAMKVALVTTHLPLRAVADAITPNEVRQTVAITERALREQFGVVRPRILVCGLNPHAGEDGHLGDEEQKIINPVLDEFIRGGINISQAMPADTLFTRTHLQNADVVIAMYHDQGLAPLKSHGFGDTVNITLGLPYIRTSVDHGTALSLAASGQASSSSLVQAIRQAIQMINARAQMAK